jgi:phosphate uptake regulator
MHSRRVQKLGGSSLVVTLPKSWVKRMNIKAGDNIIVIDEGEYLRIIPAGLPSNSKSLALRFTHTLSKPENIELIVSCSYLHGYDKLVIYDDKIPKTLKGSVRTVKMKGFDKIDDVFVGDDRIVIELARNGDAPVSFLLRNLATALNDAIDRILEGRVDEARAIMAEAKVTVERIVRSASKEGLGVCEPARSSMAFGALLTVPKLVEELASSSQSVGEEARRAVLERLRRAILELLGGMSSGSTKRIEYAASEAAELAREAESVEGGAFSAYAKSLAYLLETTAKTVICRLAAEEQSLG